MSELIAKIVGIIGAIILFGLILSLPIYLLWNSCLVPAIDGVHEIGWMQAWGLNILCTGLFKSSIEPKSK
jgi:hypothetical protein